MAFLQRIFVCLSFYMVAASLVITDPVSAQGRPPKLKEGEIWSAGRIVGTLQQAFDYVPSNGRIMIGPGVFRQSGVLAADRDGVTIIGTRDTWFDGVAADGKAAFTIKADNVTLWRVGCRNIKVPSKNGSCVRLEGAGITLKNVHFKDSESGILSTKGEGRIEIRDSLFENIGKAGRAHAIYVNAEHLVVDRTRVLNAVDHAHGIKSRAFRTTITRSIVASMDGNDSRLIDIPNGGRTIIRDNLLVEGAKTVNWQMVAYGVETDSPHADSQLKMENNFIISDLGRDAFLIFMKEGMTAPIITGNVVVGKIKAGVGDITWPRGNHFFKNRAALELPPAPELPEFSMN